MSKRVKVLRKEVKGGFWNTDHGIGPKVVVEFAERIKLSYRLITKS